MHRNISWAVVAGLVALAGCSGEETSTGTGTGTAAGTATGAGTGTGVGTGAGTSTGSGTGTAGAGGSGGQAGAGGGASHPECDAVSGTCTNVRWEICPSGTEPVDPDPHKDCPGESNGIQGWCCVDAPASSCSDQSSGNCVVGTECKDCWGPVDGYTCEAGRVCCQDICD